MRAPKLIAILAATAGVLLATAGCEGPTFPMMDLNCALGCGPTMKFPSPPPPPPCDSSQAGEILVSYGNILVGETALFTVTNRARTAEPCEAPVWSVEGGNISIVARRRTSATDTNRSYSVVLKGLRAGGATLTATWEHQTREAPITVIDSAAIRHIGFHAGFYDVHDTLTTLRIYSGHARDLYPELKLGRGAARVKGLPTAIYSTDTSVVQLVLTTDFAYQVPLAASVRGRARGSAAIVAEFLSLRDSVVIHVAP